MEDAARRLGYQLNNAAKSLRQGVSKNIAVVLPCLENEAYADFYSSVSRYADKSGFQALLFLTNDVRENERQALRQITSLRAGYVFAVSCLSRPAEEYGSAFLQSGTNFVFVERVRESDALYTGESNTLCAGFDFYDAGAKIGAQISGLGYRRIGLLTSSLSYSNNSDFAKALNESIGETQIISAELRYDNAFKEAFAFLEENKNLDCIVTGDTLIAKAILAAKALCCREGELAVFSLSSQKLLKMSGVVLYELNYRLLGSVLCKRFLEGADENTGINITLPADGLYKKKNAGTGKAVSPDISLNILMAESPCTQALKWLLPAFTRETGIKVNIDAFPLPKYRDAVFFMSNSGVYDAVRVDITWLHSISPGLIPLDRFDSDIESLFERFLPLLKENYSLENGEIYTLPFDPGVQIMLYRRDLFEDSKNRRLYYEATKENLELPQTFEQFNNTARFFTRSHRSESPTMYGTTAVLGNASSTALEFITRFLEVSQGKRLPVDSPQGLLALEHYLGAVACSSRFGSNWRDCVADFASGCVAIIVAFSGHTVDIIQKNSKVMGMVGSSTIPGGYPLIGGGSLGIPANAPNPEAAFKFINWACGEDIAVELTMLGGSSPCRKAFESEEVLSLYPWMETTRRDLSIGVRRAVLVEDNRNVDYSKMETAIGILMQNCVNKSIIPEQAVKYAQEIIENSIRG